WYPGYIYYLVISAPGYKTLHIKVPAPWNYPVSGIFDIGNVQLLAGQEEDLTTIAGLNSIKFLKYDQTNDQYYKELFNKLTVDKNSDDEKFAALNDFVAKRRN